MTNSSTRLFFNQNLSQHMKYVKKIPITHNQSESTKNISAIKPLRQCSETLDIKHKTDICGLGAAKEKRKAIRTGIFLCSNIAKRCGYTTINQKVI